MPAPVRGRRFRIAPSILVLLLLCASPPALGAPAEADSAARVDSLRLAVASDRRDVDSRRRLAAFLGRSEDIEERRQAVEMLTDALRIDDADADLWAQLARIQERRGFRGEARRALTRALELAPRRPDLRGELAAHDLRRFQTTFRMADLASATAENDTALSLGGDDPAVLHRAVRLARIQGRDARLDSLVSRWARAAPADPWPPLIRGMRLVEAEAWTRAEEAFDAGFLRLDEEKRKPFITLAVVDPREEELRHEAADSTRFWLDYWRWRDPTPADRVNPRLLEHYARMVNADLLFGREGDPVPGWDQAPGKTLIRYGLPGDWSYLADVKRVGEYRVNSSLSVPAVSVRFGEAGAPLRFTFVDYNLNGRLYNPIEAFPRNADFFMVENPSLYPSPLPGPERDQELELWRFADPDGGGRVVVAAALDPAGWPRSILDQPHRLSSRLALYDPRWQLQDRAVASWALFRRDSLGRLVGEFTLDAGRDSLIVGIETADRDEGGRAESYAALAPASGDTTGPVLSDVAFLSGVTFDPGSGAYPWAYGYALPNPGHRYPSGDPIGIGFEAYRLGMNDGGRHRVRIHVAVVRQTSRGLFPVLLRKGGLSGSEPEGEMAFDAEDTGSRLEQLLSLDIPPLEPGGYRLTLRVEDLVAGTERTRAVPFTVVDGESRP